MLTGMQVVYHLGVHATDEDRLVRSLLKDRERLARLGVSVPAPSRYRTPIRQALVPLKGAPATPEAQAALLAQVSDDDAPRRIVFSHESFLCLAPKALSEEGFYGQAGRRVAGLANLFAGAASEFHLALRNPATLVPALMARNTGADYAAFMHDLDPARLSWVPVVAAMHEAVPEARLVIWCDEDSPILWGDLLRGLAGLEAEAPILGAADQVGRLITAEGRGLLGAAMQGDTPPSAAAMRALFAAHLDRHALPGVLETEVDLPGWDADLIAEMTANYDRDVAEIGRMPGVGLILP